MKKSRIAFCILTMIVALGLNVPANAGQITIGTATYNGSDYNLIWDDDNNGNSVVWLDYTHSGAIWTGQKSWALGLNGSGVLTYNFDPGYTVIWNAPWRLPTTVDGSFVFGYDGTTTGGYNITSSEMGHLFYAELGNIGYYDTSGSGPQAGWGLTNTGDFQNLSASYYWSGMKYSANTNEAWLFYIPYGNQYTNPKTFHYSALAVRLGNVAAAPVPEPTTIVLLGIGLAGMAVYGVRRRRQLR